LSLDSAKFNYPATTKKKRREYLVTRVPFSKQSFLPCSCLRLKLDLSLQVLIIVSIDGFFSETPTGCTTLFFIGVKHEK
jgi:hypothetical protein